MLLCITSFALCSWNAQPRVSVLRGFTGFTFQDSTCLMILMQYETQRQLNVSRIILSRQHASARAYDTTKKHAIWSNTPQPASLSRGWTPGWVNNMLMATMPLGTVIDIIWHVLTWICYCILILYNTCWTKFDGKQVHATNFPPFTINFSGHLISSATTVPLVLAFLLQNKWFDSFIAVCFFWGSIPKRQALGIQKTDAVCEGTDSWVRLSKRSLVRNGHFELSIGFLLILYGFLWIPYCRFIYV